MRHYILIHQGASDVEINSAVTEQQLHFIPLDGGTFTKGQIMIDERIEKQRAVEAEKMAASPDYQAQCGGGASTLNQCRRASLRERVQNDIWRLETDTRRAAQLNELAALLEKNPDIARILDLIEVVRG